MNEEITCTATGHSSLTVFWRNINGSIVDNIHIVVGSQVEVPNKHDNITDVNVGLLVENITRQDSGMYSCLAMNDFTDHLNVTIKINVQCKQNGVDFIMQA